VVENYRHDLAVTNLFAEVRAVDAPVGAAAPDGDGDWCSSARKSSGSESTASRTSSSNRSSETTTVDRSHRGQRGPLSRVPVRSQDRASSRSRFSRPRPFVGPSFRCRIAPSITWPSNRRSGGRGLRRIPRGRRAPSEESTSLIFAGQSRDLERCAIDRHAFGKGTRSESTSLRPAPRTATQRSCSTDQTDPQHEHFVPSISRNVSTTAEAARYRQAEHLPSTMSAGAQRSMSGRPSSANVRSARRSRSWRRQTTESRWGVARRSRPLSQPNGSIEIVGANMT
jgi:hypothetical protein